MFQMPSNAKESTALRAYSSACLSALRGLGWSVDNNVSNMRVVVRGDQTLLVAEAVKAEGLTIDRLCEEGYLTASSCDLLKKLAK